ncbi:glucose-1-phosphate cytidylyltransferase [Trinickia symbiotica]|uniref:Glucose-1-phosphate cytidylyltransferase n=1 Tax=Trinickia symbiotica TaxID=863227 RepID=A0A2T3XNP7_9BURK|nr:glucose-1-phosphate cytidylyltransferase [Trinickia symbiotica]PTB18087.1 glucose-1-phosphate cytidylyltransferase [Trinickia symbiotica]
MKAVILAGGLGTRLMEETTAKPKPLVEVGGKPVLWHIMKVYAAHGIHEFIVCAGYKGYLIKEYFANYMMHNADVTFDIARGAFDVHHHTAEPWRVTVVDTGEKTMTGGRLKRIRPYLNRDDFCMTYGDGIGDIDISSLIDYHRGHGCDATVTAAQPPGRFGALHLDGEQVVSFKEKPQGDGGWVNAGFFVLNPRVLDYIDGDDTLWEQEPIERLTREGQLRSYFHHGFWQPMDTLRDKTMLDTLWSSGSAPWKCWT